MGIRYSTARSNAHKGGNLTPNKLDNQSILNFKGYYKASEIEYGKHGPEAHSGDVYISIYHFMQYRKSDPSNYDTLRLGAYLSSRLSCGYTCKYQVHDYSINKFKFTDLLDYEHIFKQYRL